MTRVADRPDVPLVGIAFGLAALVGLAIVAVRRAHAPASEPSAPPGSRGSIWPRVPIPAQPVIAAPPAPRDMTGDTAMTYTFPPSGNPDLDAYRRTHPSINERDPLIVQWQPDVIVRAALAGVPPAFAMGYLAIESGGNVAAVGSPTATGPDGQPREIGLFQIYNPDDFKALGADPAELRAYTVPAAPGPKQHREKDGGYLDGTQRNPQKLSRPLTAAELDRHVALGIANILRHKAYADHYLSASGYQWAASGPDYWAAVKLVHALPVIVNTGMAQVKAHLGRAPTSWHEFRATYEQIQPRARFSPEAFHAGKDQDGYFRALENAEWTGGHVQPTGTVA